MKVTLLAAVIGLSTAFGAKAQEMAYVEFHTNDGIQSASRPEKPKLVTDKLMDVDDPKSEELAIEIYPNPGNGIMNVVSPTGPIKIEVYDLAGNRHLQQEVSLNANQRLKIDLDNLKDGMYLVKINGKVHRYVKQ